MYCFTSVAYASKVFLMRTLASVYNTQAFRYRKLQKGCRFRRVLNNRIICTISARAPSTQSLCLCRLYAYNVGVMCRFIKTAEDFGCQLLYYAVWYRCGFTSTPLQSTRSVSDTVRSHPQCVQKATTTRPPKD